LCFEAGILIIRINQNKEGRMRYSFEATAHSAVVPALAALLILLAACHPAKTPIARQADVDAAQEDARKELDQAHVEARKDVKSAVKVSGGEPKNVAVARAIIKSRSRSA
jgi:ABC-type lipoprotein export system ATPase subunit